MNIRWKEQHLNYNNYKNNNLHSANVYNYVINHLFIKYKRTFLLLDRKLLQYEERLMLKKVAI